jgi:hypothetical protein
MSAAIGPAIIKAPEAAPFNARGGKVMTRAEMRSRTRRSEQTEYRLIAALTYPVFLIIAAASFCVPRGLRAKLPGLDIDGSLFARARSLADTSIPFVFMG